MVFLLFLFPAIYVLPGKMAMLILGCLKVIYELFYFFISSIGFEFWSVQECEENWMSTTTLLFLEREKRELFVSDCLSCL